MVYCREYKCIRRSSLGPNNCGLKIQIRNKVSYNWYQNGPWETLSLRESLAIIWGMTSVSMELHNYIYHTHISLPFAE